MDNITDFKSKYPDLYQAVFDEGSAEGEKKGFDKGAIAGVEKGRAEVQDKAKADGAKAERERIQSVEVQSIPGHEKLIQELKFDGKTTGEQAAVKILQAEKALRLNMKAQLDDDAVEALDHVADSAIKDDVASLLEGPDKWKAQYEKSADLQKEFKTLETYTAFRKGVAEGRVKILGKEVK